MTNEPAILTTKDFTILEIMLDRSTDPTDSLTSLLKRKIASAIVVFRDDVPETVATLSSRVSFHVDGNASQTRILSADRMSSTTGLFQPVTTLRGLALLGLAAGRQFVFANGDGVAERIVLETVDYQPEAARREQDRLTRPEDVGPRPALKLIRGGIAGAHRSSPLGPGMDPVPPAA